MASIWSILKAEFLINENALKNWGFVIVLVLMGISIINLSHSADAKVKKIVKLNKEVKALRSEYIELKAKVMKRKMATDVYVRLKNQGFQLSKEQPIKIVVNNE
jgi:hypothetical protein